MIAVVGGDDRERYLACRLAAAGYQVRVYGGIGGRSGHTTEGPQPVRARGFASAVRDAEWLVFPTPGINDEGALYAPFHDGSILVREVLRSAKEAHRGGVVLGRATDEVQEIATELGFEVHEVATAESVRLRLAASAAEGVIGVLLDRTDRILAECTVLVVGTGRVAGAVARLLRAWQVPTVVAGRDGVALRSLAGELGVRTVPYGGRVGALAGVHVVVNTVPSQDALSDRLLSKCRGKVVVDIASPPGGRDHTVPPPEGVDVYWARGLAGSRAPATAGDALFDLVVSLAG